MIEARQNVIDVCEKVLKKAKESSVNENTCIRITALGEKAREEQLVVPVVGAFSSGKSSLINSLLEKNILPVAITPETSLATELHYSPSEFIEAVKEDGTAVRYAVEDIGTVTKDAAKYAYARLYLNNKRLQEIEPLILVDMPGFDSPLDAHNKAIMAYIARGCHYIVLSSIDEGTVTASLNRRLREIDGFGRGFSFFISKADLKPDGETAEVVSYFQKILKDSFDIHEPVRPIKTGSSSEVMGVLKGLNTSSIFYSVYRDQCLMLFNDVIDNLNVLISASRKSASEIQDAIKELQGSIEKLKQKATADTENMQRSYSGGMVSDIVNDVGKALESAADELIGVAQAGNHDELNRRLNEIVRSTLVVSIRDKLGAVNHQIVMDFSESIKGLDKVMKDLDISQDYVNELAGKIQSAFELFQGSDILKTGTPDGKTAANLGMKAAGTGLSTGLGGIGTALAGRTGISTAVGLTATIINPILGAVVLFLPEIIGLFKKLFGGGEQQNQRETIRSKLTGEVFPQIKRKIREELPAHIGEQVQILIEQVKKQYEEKIAQEETAIKAAVEEKTAGKVNAEEKLKALESARTEIQSYTNTVMGWA
jgi:hypothetical protein